MIGSWMKLRCWQSPLCLGQVRCSPSLRLGTTPNPQSGPFLLWMEKMMTTHGVTSNLLTMLPRALWWAWLLRQETRLVCHGLRTRRWHVCSPHLAQTPHWIWENWGLGKQKPWLALQWKLGLPARFSNSQPRVLSSTHMRCHFPNTHKQSKHHIDDY